MRDEQLRTPVAAGERWPASIAGGVRCNASVDVLLAVALFALHIVLTQSQVPQPPSWHYVVVAVGCGAVAVRQSVPKAGFAAVLAAGVLVVCEDHPVQIGLLVLWIGLYTVVSRCAVGWAVSAAAAAVGFLVFEMFRDARPVRVPDVMIVVLATAVIAALGWVVKRSRRRAAALEQAMDRLRQAEWRFAAEVVLVERTRIARELHDLVAQGLSRIALRAGVARMLLSDDQVMAKESVEVIEHAARESAAEMRHLRGALCSVGEDAQGQEPQLRPGLDRLEELVSSSGLPVRVIWEGTPRVLPAGRELAAYRIVQEALTNVHKHAAAAPVTVTVDHQPDKLVVDVFNTMPRTQPMPVAAVVPWSVQERGGHGLIGMRERAALYGGTLRAGSTSGGYRVTAEIPIGAS